MNYDEVFQKHKILVRENSKIIFAREDESIFRFAVSLDGIGTMTVTGDFSPVSFGHCGKMTDVCDAINWLGSAKYCDSYVQEKALIGTGKESERILMVPKWERVKEFLQDWSKEIEEEDPNNDLSKKLLEMRSFNDEDWNDFLMWSDNFYVETCFDDSIFEIASAPSQRLELAHAALRCAYRLINEK